uniref:V-set and transmembrane domain containing 2 like n=1 Tax=Oryzias sinensis TaxID=183150 RepID=A0A8C8DZB0_9TELE
MMEDFFQIPTTAPADVSIQISSLPAVMVSGYAFGNQSVFTEVPQDVITNSGEDVEMACSFSGPRSPSCSLEIQWWYIKNHWQDKPTYLSNNVSHKESTKISVVKVVGSNISHKLRLSSVKASDEGTYECRVIDNSGAVAQHHRVRAYLQVNTVETGESQKPSSREQTRG